MKKINKDDVIFEEKELNYLLEFIKKKWTGIDKKIQSDLRYAYQQGLEKAKYWINYLDFTKLISELEKVRLIHLEKNLPDEYKPYLDLLKYADPVMSGLYRFNFGLMDYDKIMKSEFKYEKEIKILINQFKINNNDIKPIGWDFLLKNYQDFDGYDTYNIKSDQELFGGVDSATAGSSGFHLRINLPTTMYNEICQGHDRVDTLIGAFFAHGIFVSIHNNNFKVSKDLVEMVKRFEKVGIYYVEDMTGLSNNKIIQGVLHCHKPYDFLTSKKSFETYVKESLQPRAEEIKQEMSEEDIINDLIKEIQRDNCNDEFKEKKKTVLAFLANQDNHLKRKIK